MRNFTNWFLLLVTVALAATLSTAPAHAEHLDMAPSIQIVPVNEKWSGVMVQCTFTVYTAVTDPAGKTLGWDEKRPECSFSSTEAFFFQPTNKDYVRQVLSTPTFVLRNGEDFYVTLDDRLASARKAAYKAGIGYYIDWKPGTLPLGMSTMKLYLAHKRNQAGFNLAFIPIRWATKGEAAAQLHINVLEAPDFYDRLPAELRKEFRGPGFLGVRTDMAPETRAKIDQYLKEHPPMQTVLVPVTAASPAPASTPSPGALPLPPAPPPPGPTGPPVVQPPPPVQTPAQLALARSQAVAAKYGDRPGQGKIVIGIIHPNGAPPQNGDRCSVYLDLYYRGQRWKSFDMTSAQYPADERGVVIVAVPYGERVMVSVRGLGQQLTPPAGNGSPAYFFIKLPY